MNDEPQPREMPPDAVIERFAATVAPLMRAFNWHWYHEGEKCHIPSLQKIIETLRMLCAEVASRKADCARTGGFIVDWNEDYERIDMSFVINIDAEYD